MAENPKAEMRRHRTQCLKKRIDDLLSNRRQLAIALEKRHTYGEFIDYAFIWSDVKHLFMSNPDGYFKYLDRLVTELNKIIDDENLEFKQQMALESERIEQEREKNKQLYKC